MCSITQAVDMEVQGKYHQSLVLHVRPENV